MGFFDRFRAVPHAHPVFGELTYKRGLWHGTITLEHGRPLRLLLPGTREAPAAGGLEVAALAPAWWGQVRAQVEREIYGHYEAYRDADAPDVPRLAGQSEIWPHVDLTSMQVQPYSAPDEIMVAARVAWDEEHTLGVLIRDGRLVELNGSILEAR